MPETLVLDEFAFGLGPDVVTYEVLWQTFAADACLKCQMLQGETWNLKSLTGTLVSESQGAVYDLDADVCITHPNCRCFLHVVPQIELENIELFKALKETFVKAGEEVPSNIEDAKRELHDLKENVLMTDMTIRQYERVLYRVIALAQRLGLPPETQAMLQRLQQIVMTVRMLTVSLSLLEMSTPYGIISGAIGLVGTGLSVGELIYDGQRGF
jgi:hypothetical protein